MTMSIRSAGLDDLEAFVHHRRRVDGNLVAHPPRRMSERGLDADLAERDEIAIQKRTARGGEDDALHFLVQAGTQRLMHGVVFGVDGKNLAAVLARGARHHVAGGDEHFLVRDADALARAQRRVHRCDAGGADDRGNDRVSGWHRGDGARAFEAGDHLDVETRA